MINRKSDLRETVHSFLSDYLTQLVTLPSWRSTASREPCCIA